MAKVICFTNQKGGVGKTTTCVNISACLSSLGKKVLVVDFSPEANATTGLGINKHNLEKSVYNSIISGFPLKEVVIKTDFKNLFIAPANKDLAGAELELATLSGRNKRLLTAIESVREEYDFIMIDCPPSLSTLTINALFASDKVILPISPDFYAVQGAVETLNLVKLIQKTNANLDLLGVVLTMYDTRALVYKQIAEEIKNYFGDKVFKTVIPRNVRVLESPSHGLPVIEHAPDCQGSKAYFSITKELLKREKNNG